MHQRGAGGRVGAKRGARPEPSCSNRLFSGRGGGDVNLQSVARVSLCMCEDEFE